MSLSEDEADRLATIISTVGEVRHKLNTKSRAFFDQTEQRFDEHGADTFLSPAQWRWLESLMEQFG